MNILFIEDEKELAATGIAQLELKGYTVFPAYDIQEAQAILNDPKTTIHFIITDHRLPDGLGIQFLLDIKETFPICKCAVVSGCLTDGDIEEMESHEIPYYRKPLLYAKVIDELRRSFAAQAPEHEEPEEPEEPEPEEETKKGSLFWPFK